MLKVSTRDMSREQWLELRRKGIGGSDAAAIVGLNPYKSALSVYYDKLGVLPEQEENEQMRQGRDFEDTVAKRFEEATGKKVRRENAIIYHNDYDYIFANVDRIVVKERAGLECKTTSVWNRSDFKNGNYPETYYAQCLHYMMVTGLKKWYLAVLVLSQGFYWFEIDGQDPLVKADMDALLEQEISFWNEHVLKGNPPEADGSESSNEALIEVTKERSNDTILLYGHEKDLEQYLTIGAQIKDLEGKRELAKQKLIQGIGTHGSGVLDGYSIQITKVSGREQIDVKKLRKELPDIYGQYMKYGKPYVKLDVKKEA